MLRARSEIQFDNYLNWKIGQKGTFKLISSNSEQRLVSDESRNRGMRYRNKLTDDEMKLLWVFAAIKKSAKKKINSMERSEFEFHSLSSKRWNHDLYRSLEDSTEFVGIDINHAYLRTAYLKGYINDGLYNKLMDKKYKGVRNKALACLKSLKRIKEYENGVVVSQYEEGDPALAAAYAEIRTVTFKIMNDISESIGYDLFLKYHTDCLYVMPAAADRVCQELVNKGYSYKTSQCIKMDDTIFIDGDEIKKF